MLSIIFSALLLHPSAKLPRQKLPLNLGWQFIRIDSSSLPRISTQIPRRYDLTPQQIGVAKAIELKTTGLKWTVVTLPSTPRIERLHVTRSWQGICYYRRDILAPTKWKNKEVDLTLEGAMQVSSVWLNGHYIGGRRGGYLPVVLDLNRWLNYGKENEILVRSDNRDNPLVPPGKPTSGLDFLYYGGLYRDAYLTVTNAVHITNPFLSHTPKGAGVVFNCQSANPDSALVSTKTEVTNQSNEARKIRVVQFFASQRHESAFYNLEPWASREVKLKFKVIHPQLWSPNHPHLYALKTQIFTSHLVDQKTINVGIRRLKFSAKRGLLVNGVPTRLIGTNRHQEYPYLGNALSDNASYRDIKEIKDAGFNCIRLCHYPQDPAVMNACDKLGIFAIVCAPGWQYYNPDPRFEKAVESDIKDMIRWHRNHPCVLAWEAALNETYPKKAIAEKWYAAAHSEFTQSDMTTVSDETYGFSWDWPYNSWNGGNHTRPIGTQGKPSYIREYGDWEFGGNKSTSRQPMSAGEKGQLQEAWNFVWEHNRDRGQYPSTMGDGTWVMYDYHRGYDPTIEHSGMADVFRIPRYIYRFFQSQYIAKPMVFIANQWIPTSKPTKVIVFSNGDEVRLYLNGKLIKDQRPDNGPNTPYGRYNHGGNTWDGGNCKNLVHPPFTFTNIRFKTGKLTAVSLRNGKVFAHTSVRTPGTFASLKIEFNLQGRPLQSDGADAVFVYVKLKDSRGTTIVANGVPVSLSLSGPARIVGPTIMKSQNGIASFLIQATSSSGKILVRSRSGKKWAKAVLFSRRSR